MNKVKTILSKGKLDIRSVLVCSVCEEPASECETCGGLFSKDDEVYCDDDGHHYHLDISCKPK